jgi:predicted AlkP superfamily phosphohydrolase/phosphomutase
MLMKRKILVIGLDGATFDVINPLIKEGRMPNLAGLIAAGASGCMRSTVPPVSGPAWMSLATGMKPERTSIYDFTYRKAGSYELQHISSSDYAGRAVWDYLGKAGKKVGILNYPMFFPPYPVNGFITTGLGASDDDEFTSPAAFKQELNRAAGGKYELQVAYHNIRYEDTELFLNDLQRVLVKKFRAATCLAKEKQWDFFWLVLSETDWLQHLIWQRLDERRSDSKAQRYEGFRERFKELWGLIDQAIGELCAVVGPQTNIVVLSDHGFGPNEGVFKLNVWLEREGYLAWRKGRSRVFADAKEAICGRARAIARAIKLHKLAPGLYGHARATKDKLIEKVIDQIDLDKSVAFDPGHTIPFGGIYINDQIVTSPDARRALGREIEEKLHNWADANHVNIETWQQPDSPGGRTNTGPDLLVGVNDWGCVVLKEPLGGEVFERRPYSSRHTGSHRMNGIFVAAGPDIQRGTAETVHLYDIAPTILHLFDIPVPADMDGRVREDIVTAEYLMAHPAKLQKQAAGNECRQTMSHAREMTQQEKDFVQQQLKDLGYM